MKLLPVIQLTLFAAVFELMTPGALLQRGWRLLFRPNFTRWFEASKTKFFSGSQRYAVHERLCLLYHSAWQKIGMIFVDKGHVGASMSLDDGQAVRG